jgi:phosphoribosyl-dephospho-CoA transferase
VNQYRFQRHDLAWLDPEIDAGEFASEQQAEYARSWVMKGFPLVVARQTDVHLSEPNQIILGFTLPSAPSRIRVMLRANRSAIIRHSRPILLSETINFAPVNWRIGLNNLVALFEKFKIVARVYGSLSSEIFSGMRYLDEASDLDLLLEISDETNLPMLLAELGDFPLSLPRIDGEILSSSGWAAPWRELTTALHTGSSCKVLAKSISEIRLIPAEEFIQSTLITA